MSLKQDCFNSVLKEIAEMCSNSEGEGNINLQKVSECLPQYRKGDVFYSVYKMSRDNLIISEIIRDKHRESYIDDIYIKGLTNKGYKELFGIGGTE